MDAIGALDPTMIGSLLDNIIAIIQILFRFICG